MGISENYQDDLEHENTHPDLLSQEAQEYGDSDDKKEILRKAGSIHNILARAKTITPHTTRNTQTAVAALLLMKLMTKRTESSSHCRSVMEGKGFAQFAHCTVSKRIIDWCKRIRTIRAIQLYISPTCE